MRKLRLEERTGDDGEIIQEYALVDDEDYEWLRRDKWFLKVDNAKDPEKRHYSVGRSPKRERETHKKPSLVLMNRQVMGIDDPRVHVKFKDGNPLNCQKGNLCIMVDGHSLRRLQLHWINDFRVKDIRHLSFPR